jgi:hypothetical protein
MVRMNDGSPKPPDDDASDAAAPECVIFDLDGTFAFLGDRSPYDASKAEGDEVNAAVHFVYEAIRAGKPGAAVFLVSGREDRWRAETERWLVRHGIDYDVFEDRDQVVRLWRDELDLPCFQVAWGDF